MSFFMKSYSSRWLSFLRSSVGLVGVLVLFSVALWMSFVVSFLFCLARFCIVWSRCFSSAVAKLLKIFWLLFFFFQSLRCCAVFVKATKPIEVMRSICCAGTPREISACVFSGCQARAMSCPMFSSSFSSCWAFVG